MTFTRLISLYKYYVILLFVLLVVYALGLVSPTEEMKEIGRIILIPATFLYGIFAGFYISIAVGENSHMRETTLSEIGSLSVLVSTLRVVDEKIQKQFIEDVDQYVQQVLEYEALEAMVGSEQQYAAMKATIGKLGMGKVSQPLMLKKVYDAFDTLYDARQRRYMISDNIINGLAWVILTSLSVMIITGFLLQSPNNLIYDGLILLASAAILIIMITIYEIDNFVYRENHDVFMQYRVLYKDIGLTPYYPYESVKYRRAIPVTEDLRIGYLASDGVRKIINYGPMPNKQLLSTIEKDFRKLNATVH